MAEIGIAREDQHIRAQDALLGADNRLAARIVDGDDAAHFVDRAAKAFERRSLPECEIERVQMRAGAVQHSSGIDVRGDMLAKRVTVKHLEIVVAVSPP